MGIYIKSNEQDNVVIQVTGSCETQEAKFNRGDWLSSCGCIAGLLEKILERNSTIRMYENTISSHLFGDGNMQRKSEGER